MQRKYIATHSWKKQTIVGYKDQVDWGESSEEVSQITGSGKESEGFERIWNSTTVTIVS
jgi:hypothetical protein